MLPFFEWLEATAYGQLIRDSLWLFPIIESVHLLGLCILGGSLLIVDLRMFGAGLRSQTIADISRGARPWLVGTLVLMASTGVSLFMSEAVKCYHNPSFWVKMWTLPVALGYTFLVRERVARRAGLDTSAVTRLVATGSIALHLQAAGRWIGFSS
jgi:hypothetical protein